MTEETKKELAVIEQKAVVDVFSDINVFQNAQRICKSLVMSDIVPEAYRGEGKLPNAMIALEMANRMKISPIGVMQNMHIIEGRPTWSSSFIISMINSSGKFSPLRFKYEKIGNKTVEYTYFAWNAATGKKNKPVTEKVAIEDIACTAYAIDKATGEIVYGPKVTLEMAVQEGWYNKSGSKWKTMPQLMISYRAAAFFGRLYVPEIMQGMHTDDEVEDFAEPKAPEIVTPAPAEEPKKKKAPVKKVEEPKDVEFEPVEDEAPTIAEPMNEEEKKVAAVIEEEPAADEEPVDAPFVFEE